MPAAKKRTATKKATPKTRAKSNVKSSVAKAPQLNWAVVGVVAAILVLIGTLFVLFSQAGTTVNYKTTDGSIVPRRFPGDPNPRVTKKAYWGADQLEGTTFKTRFEDVTGTSMSTVRRFWSSWDQRGRLPGQAKEDISLNRLPMYSIKPVGWTEMASGSRDAQIDEFLRGLDSAGGPVWLIVHHEPDGGGAKVGPRNEDDPGGAAAWVKMQKKFRERMNAVGTKNIALMAAMTGGFGGDLNQPKDNWWADNTFDAFLLDHYTYELDRPVADHSYWKGFSAWADAKRIPYGTAELGIRSGDAEGVGYYLPTSDCTKLTPRGISATNDQKAGDRLREFWNWGFANNKDVIAHAYFDKCVNSGDSPYALGGKQLEVFREILKQGTSAGKIQRVRDLGTPTTATAGPTTTVTVPVTPTDTPSPAPTATTAPAATLEILGLNNGATVTNAINVEAKPANVENFQSVEFLIDGKLVKKEVEERYCIGGGNDVCAPYSIADLAAGAHSLTVVLNYGNAQSVRKSISFTKQANPIPSDTTSPTAPGNLRAGLVFDAARFSYVVDLSWTASTDSGSGVKDYTIRKNGSDLVTTSNLSYRDTAIVANTPYAYAIYANDRSGNISNPTSANIIGRCFLVWCWSE